MKTLNTSKLLRQCQKIKNSGNSGSSGSSSIVPSPLGFVHTNITITKPESKQREEAIRMDSVELERYLTTFLNAGRDAHRRYDEAVAAEERPNAAIQDYLHQIEFDPEILEADEVIQRLHDLRCERREVKKELEVSTLWKDWAEENRIALNKLNEVLGKIRKVLERQPRDIYFYKTNEIGKSGGVLQGKSTESSDE